MATYSPQPKLLVIVGSTASGKSALALKIAKKYAGEIITADSRTVYKGMDIGTAKPTMADRAAVPHWGLDLVEPGQSYSAAKFKTYAKAKILDIQNRDKLPIIVGGTGLYVDGVVFDYGFVKPSGLRRLVYSRLSDSKLHAIIGRHKWAMPENPQNRRHLLRNIERKGYVGSRTYIPPKGTLIIGLKLSDQLIQKRIQKRVETYFAGGLAAETIALSKKYGAKSINRSGGIAYRVGLQLIAGNILAPQAKDDIQKTEWQYVRRQRTWFKRNPYIKWFSDIDSAEKYLKSILNT